MGIKHLPGRDYKEIFNNIEKELNKIDWKDHLYKRIEERLAQKAEIIDKTRGVDIFKTLVWINTFEAKPIDHTEYYKKYELLWDKVGLTKEYFTSSDKDLRLLKEKLFGWQESYVFGREKPVPAYPYMHKIYLMVRRCRPHVKRLDEQVGLLHFAWRAGYNSYMDAYYGELGYLINRMRNILPH